MVTRTGAASGRKTQDRDSNGNGLTAAGEATQKLHELLHDLIRWRQEHGWRSVDADFRHRTTRRERARDLLAMGADPTAAVAAVDGRGRVDAMDLALCVGDPFFLDLIAGHWPAHRPLQLDERMALDASAPDGFGASPLLHWMVRCGGLQAAEWLLQQGYPVDRLDRYGESALFHAESPEALELLLDGGASREIVSRRSGCRYPVGSQRVMIHLTENLRLLTLWNEHSSAPQRPREPLPVEVDRLTEDIWNGRLVNGLLVCEALGVTGLSVGTEGSVAYALARLQLGRTGIFSSPCVMR